MALVDTAAHYFKVACSNHPAVVEVKVVAQSVIAVVDFRVSDKSLMPHIMQVVDVFPSIFPGVGFGVEPVADTYAVDGSMGRGLVPSLIVPTMVK